MPKTTPMTLTKAWMAQVCTAALLRKHVNDVKEHTEADNHIGKTYRAYMRQKKGYLEITYGYATRVAEQYRLW